MVTTVPSAGPGAAVAGLTTAEAQRRTAAGLGNATELSTSRPVAAIVRANVLTRFNAIIVSLAAVILLVGDPIDAAFGLVSVINSGIGIVQELRAKRSLDALRVLLVPQVTVVRDSIERAVPPDELVKGDLVRLRVGDQVPVDAVVEHSDGLEVDESSLSGESEPQPKESGDQVLSGSAVVAGAASITATRVGYDAWAQRLTAEARQFDLTRSELRVGIDRLLRVTSWLLPPMTALLVWSQLRSDAEPADGVVAAVAGVVALVPQGLVLLVSMAMAVAVVRLARQQVVAQELPAVEGLARVDMLCVDKTGTLTTGRLVVERVQPIGTSAAELGAGLAALSGLEVARNATLDALRSHLDGAPPDWELARAVAFSSVRKWSAGTFEGRGTWVLGAPEVLLDAMEASERPGIEEQLEQLTAAALRVLLVGHAEVPPGADDALPAGLRPVGLVAFTEELRPDAATTLAYFRRQGVAIKVISGDNPRTVSAVARQLGLEGADHFVDLRTVASIDDIPAATSIFGRVRPEQKRDLVRHLQAQGHTVAMTGDGVNDIPSIKAADIGIAMNTATPATKATAQLILMDGRFEHLPVVVAEGRRVIANMERVSSLFVTKTVYAAALALVFGLSGVAFPFLPRHLTVVATVTIGIPAFLMSFRAVDEPCRPGYLSRVLRFATPAGLSAAGATIVTFAAVRSSPGGADLAQARTAATIALTVFGLWILYRLARPLDRWERLLLVGLLVAFGVTVSWGPTATLYALRLPPIAAVAPMSATVVGFGLVLEGALRFQARRPATVG
ncbi:MAG: HAD-IC family P-type ATPase, partial [Actinomycetota bacterium]